MAQCTPKSFDLTGKVALITGASYGIGMAIAKAMAANGATIVFNDIKQELVDKGLAAYEEAGIKAHGYVCDVTDEDAVNAMVAKITEEVGHINILVNNAGIIKRIPMTEMTAAQFRQVIDVDLNAPFIVAKAVIPDMIAQGGGKIINICSMMSELGRETVSAYAAAKGGLKMLTKNIASEYGEYNIQCNGIGPGYIATPQTAPLRERQPDGSRHPFDSFIVAKTPAGRWGEAEDLGGPAVFLASAASDFVNGLILYVDGGILASSASSRSKFFHIRHFLRRVRCLPGAGHGALLFPISTFFPESATLVIIIKTGGLPHEDRTYQREQSGRKERHHRGRSEEGRRADGPRGGQLRHVRCR